MIFNDQSVRSPAVAGQFYESSPERLRGIIKSMVDGSIESDGARDGDSIRAMIMPHAGYMCSGQTAVDTFRLVENGSFKKVLVIAPSHRVPFRGLAAAGEYKKFRTPLGDIEVDTDTSNAILNSNCSMIQDLAEAHEYEHSLEVELPIIQYFFPEIKLIPFICGKVSIESAREIAGVLYEHWDSETLLVISSDFTHYGRSFNYVPFTDDIPENLKKLDLGAVEKIKNLDIEGFEEYIRSTGATVCGSNPIKVLLALLEIAEKNGCSLTPKLVDYTTSGALTGDYSHCVSYVGMVFS